MSDRSDGFTLIETLVALVIFAGVFAALTASLSGGSKGLRVAQMDQRALMLAKAKLASAGLEARLFDGQQEAGDDDGFGWRVDVRQRVPADGEIKDLGQRAFWVLVSVTWLEGPLRKIRTTELKGLKLSAAP
jgi:prepilin-type N-terminal cleavage/methylation domain-containing protein